MASSPLTLAMLGGGAGLGGIQDPAYLPASRHLALAQNLIGQGLEGSPTPWTGALARVLMAGLGAHELNAGESEFANVTGQRQHAALDAINYMRGDGASPLASAITGPAPTMQEAPPAAQPSAPSAAPTPPPALASAVHQLESGGSTAPGVTGDGGAAGGVMQVHQGALTDVNHALGTNYTMDQVTADPAIGKKVGDAYLGLQYARFPGHPELALAAYNAGPTATANAVSNGTGLAGLPQSTQAYVTKGIQLAGGDAGAPALPQGGGAAPGAAATPGAPPTGLQAPNVARAMQMMQRAQEVAAANPYNSAIQEAARMQIQQAQVIAGLDNFVPTTQNGIAGQLNARTNEFKPTLTGTPRFATGPHGETIVGLPGGGVQTLNNNVSGMKAGSPEQVIAELGPKVQAGTATPQEQANYATAATLFQNPQVHTEPASQGLVSISKPLPAGMPTPGAAAGNPPPSNVQTLTPGGRGAATAQAIDASHGENDVKNLSDEAAKTMSGHSMLGTTSNIRSMLPQVTTGVGADQRLRAAEIFTALGVDPKTAQSWTGTNAAPGEILQKRLFELSTGAVRAMGAREPGSVIGMFQKNYPNMTSRDMTIDAMTRILDMDQIYKENELAARGQHLTTQIQGVAQNQPYKGLTEYQPPDPRIYQAAALATGGMPFSAWSQGLTPDQQTNALQLAAKVYPDASALDENGIRHFFQGHQQ